MTQAARAYDRRIGDDDTHLRLQAALGAHGMSVLGLADTSASSLSWPRTGGFVRWHDGNAEWLLVDPLGRASPVHGVGTFDQAVVMATGVRGWASPRPQPLTDERCLALSRQSGLRLELVNGRIFAMTIAKKPHNEVQSRLNELLVLRKWSGCRVYGESTMLHVDETNWVNPDLWLVCGEWTPPPGHPDRLLNPTLVVEIWSKSNTKKEKERKLQTYLHIESLRHYLTLDSLRQRGELWTRDGDGGWTRHVLRPGDTVTLEHLGISFTMEEVYEGTGVPKPRS